ncbi:M57 family metalloprotease [Secundilactobacillus malefermentans]|uniref:Peptidase metallopeptidase domain-containing protein n=1 Tax=Secundilactobacillus malefermentans TaxID=176292 RepID=A0A4V3A3P7_9LACO|nr:M57 family metalloprotease [Secundilactobacillus malefermentans]TDG75415.1 hypothetical protein C5L31_000289 [Secundilactobacillus malefermentans]
MKRLSLFFWLFLLIGAGVVYENEDLRDSAAATITEVKKSIELTIPQIKQAYSPKEESRSESKTVTTSSKKETPLESNVPSSGLSKTYYYHFSKNVPTSVRNVFEQAVEKYNQTGLVKLIAGEGTAKQNQINFFVYKKNMSDKQQGAVELGHGGPQIIQQYGFGAYTANHARSGLNIKYSQSVKLSVAMHELGHALGLGHSDQQSYLMYPIDQGITTLSDADLKGLKSIYQK